MSIHAYAGRIKMMWLVGWGRIYALFSASRMEVARLAVARQHDEIILTGGAPAWLNTRVREPRIWIKDFQFSSWIFLKLLKN
jgi:hypothetical protein